MKYFVANWKAYKNLEEAEMWINTFENKLSANQNLQEKLTSEKIKIIIAPPHPFLSDLKFVLQKFRLKHSYFKNIHLSAQDISQFDEGNYTGEDTAKSLKGLVDFTIIGHSERRKFISETDKMLFQKSEMAAKYKIQPIYVIRDEKDAIPANANIVAFEPETAIGTGDNQTPEEIIKVKRKLNLSPGKIFLYGGSVNSHNSSTYLKSEDIDGFLIGKASLDPVEFVAIANST